MKLAEVSSVFTIVFLVTLTIGDGAPQWRPQGRFGKRMETRVQYPNSWQPEVPSGMDVFPVITDKLVTQKDSSDSSKNVNIMDRLCVESSLPGLFKCYRKKRSISLNPDPEEEGSQFMTS